MGLGPTCEFKWDPEAGQENGRHVPYRPRRACGLPVTWAWYRPGDQAASHYSCDAHYAVGSVYYNKLFNYQPLTPESRAIVVIQAQGPRLVRQRIERIRRSNVPADEVDD